MWILRTLPPCWLTLQITTDDRLSRSHTKIFQLPTRKKWLREYRRAHTGSAKREFLTSLIEKESQDRRFKVELTDEGKNIVGEMADPFDLTGLTRCDDFLVQMVNRLGMPMIVCQQKTSGLFDGFPFRVSHPNSRFGDLLCFGRQEMRL